jgi:hypothetical protein
MQIQRYLNATTNRGIEVNSVVARVSLVSYITSLSTNPIVAIEYEYILILTSDFNIEFASNFYVLQVHQASRKPNDCILPLGSVSHIWSLYIVFSSHL